MEKFLSPDGILTGETANIMYEKCWDYKEDFSAFYAEKSSKGRGFSFSVEVFLFQRKQDKNQKREKSNGRSNEMVGRTLHFFCISSF